MVLPFFGIHYIIDKKTKNEFHVKENENLGITQIIVVLKQNTKRQWKIRRKELQFHNKHIVLDYLNQEIRFQ